MKTTAGALVVSSVLLGGSALQAQFSVGTWVQTAPMKGLTMTVEECCNGGRRLTFHITLGKQTQTMTVESRFDGSDSPVLADGQPNGETMALKRVSDRETTTVFKRNGKIYRTSTSTESADRKTLIVENVMIEPAGKMTETYVRK